MLVVRDLSAGPKRTTELLTALHPISSRTLVGRLRDMEHDAIIERRDFGGSPPRVEYFLTDRGRRLLPLLESLRKTGEALDCNSCDDRKEHLGIYCDSCPRSQHNSGYSVREEAYNDNRPRESDDSIVLL
jgi:DNA-binding HxlR family transcriptional regulator